MCAPFRRRWTRMNRRHWKSLPSARSSRSCPQTCVVGACCRRGRAPLNWVGGGGRGGFDLSRLLLVCLRATVVAVLATASLSVFCLLLRKACFLPFFDVMCATLCVLPTYQLGALAACHCARGHRSAPDRGLDTVRATVALRGWPVWRPRCGAWTKKKKKNRGKRGGGVAVWSTLYLDWSRWQGGGLCRLEMPRRASLDYRVE